MRQHSVGQHTWLIVWYALSGPYLSHCIAGGILVALLLNERLSLLPEALLQQRPQQGAALGQRL